MSTVNPPGSGTNQPIQPSNEVEDEELNRQNNNDANDVRSQTGHGERIKGMTIRERMAANKGGIKTADAAPTVRQTQQTTEENNNAPDTRNNS